MPRKPCKSHQFRRRRTPQRCLNKDSDLGRAVLAAGNPASRSPARRRKPSAGNNRSLKPCKPHQIRKQRKPRRCVNKDGPAGKSALRYMMRAAPAPVIPPHPISPQEEADELKEIEESEQLSNAVDQLVYSPPQVDMHQEYIDLSMEAVEEYGPEILYADGGSGIILLGVLGEGAFGKVYAAQSDRHPIPFALKVQVNAHAPVLANEIRMGRKFQEAGLTPAILFFKKWRFMRDRVSVIGMDIVTAGGMLDDILKNPLPIPFLERIYGVIQQMIKTMCEKNFVHGDFHWGNIGFMKDNNRSPQSLSLNDDIFGDGTNVRLAVIDFGWSSTSKCNPQLELLQLIRTIPLSDIDKSNADYLFFRLKHDYDENSIGGGEVTTPEQANRKFFQLHKKYERNVFLKAVTPQ